MVFFQNTCLKERSNMAVTPNFWVTMSLYKKECLPVIRPVKIDMDNEEPRHFL